MEIYSSQFAHRTHGISGPHFRTSISPGQEMQQTERGFGRDEVRFSQEAQQLSQSEAVSPSSAPLSSSQLDRINRIRSEIAAGTYETPEKLEMAFDRMLGEVERGF